MRALIVEDEAKMAKLLHRGLSEEGYSADVALTGERAITMANASDYDVIVLDVMLPGMDGFEVCRRLRDAGVRSPALMLTARDAVEDRIEGLDSGADDYLPKPFSFAELNARLRALARRGPVEQGPVIEVGDLRIDPRTHQVWRGEVEIELSTKAFAILETLMRRAGEVLSRFDLLEHAWDRSYENRSNIIDVYIKNLRAKIDRPFGVRSIETVRRAGYRLRVDGGVPVTREQRSSPPRHSPAGTLSEADQRLKGRRLADDVPP
jgi:two-component system OmpR family response regulator